jgi:hypothetical protein
MKPLVWLLWISPWWFSAGIHHEVQQEHDATQRDKPDGTAHARPPHWNRTLCLWLGRAVGAARDVKALVGKHEPLHRFSVHDVGFDDFLHVGSRDASVPDAIGIDHDRGSVLALVETSRHIGAHSFLETPQGQFLLEQELQLGLARGIAAPARMSSLALIATDEEMLFELGHEINCTGFPSPRSARRNRVSLSAALRAS